MKNRLVFPLFSLLLVSLLFSRNAFSQNTQDTVVRVAPHALNQDSDPRIVDIVIENGQNVAGYQVKLQFDSHFMKYAEIDHGDYLPKAVFSGEPQIIDIDPNDPKNTLKVILFAVTSIAGEGKGNGVLATLKFNRENSGASDLILLDETLLSNRAAEPSFPRLEDSRTHLNGVANLTVESVQAKSKNTTAWEQSHYNKGEEFELHATVRNIGNWKSASPQLQLYGPTGIVAEKGEPLEPSVNIEQLEPNRAVDISLPVAALEAAGVYYYTVCIEGYEGWNRAGKNVKDNNCYTLEITVEEGPPDLIVESVEAYSIIYGPTASGPANRGPVISEVSPRQEFKFSATVKNRGFEASAMTVLRYYRFTDEDISTASKDDELLEAILIHPLSADSTFTKPISVTAPKTPGTYYYSACVDSVEGELETGNNCAKYVAITVRQSDISMQLLRELIKNEMDYFTLGADVNKDTKIDSDDEAIVTEILEDEKPFKVGNANARADVNGDGKFTEMDLQLVRFALKLDVNDDGVINASDSTHIADAMVVQPVSLKNDVNSDGVVSNYDQFLVNTAVKYAVRNVNPPWTFPENLISEVAYGENSTYFVFNPQFAQDENGAVGYKNTITLDIPGAEDYDRNKSLEDLLNELPEEYPYFIIPLFPPDVGEVRRAITATKKGVDEEAVSLGWAILGVIPVDKLHDGAKVVIESTNFLKSVYDVFQGLKNTATKVIELNKEQRAIIEEFLQPFEDPKVMIKDPSIFFPFGYGKKKNVIDNTHSFLIMIPKRLQSINIQMQQHFVRGEAGKVHLHVLPSFDNLTKIRIEFLHGGITITIPTSNPSLTRFLEISLNNTGRWGYAKGADKQKAKEDTEKILTNLLQAVQNTPIGEKLVKDLGHDSEFRAPGPNADKITFHNDWVLGHTLAAPRARPTSLADYPPFQQLPPEIQEYLLQHFEGTANTEVTNVAALQIPETTSLLPNYPNPFNPETWIPYQLANPADVTLTIYDIQGRVVRDLDLGHQRAGVYQSRARAAHWNGRNAHGEPVASGLYFYTLKAGDFTATRKMLIRK